MIFSVFRGYKCAVRNVSHSEANKTSINSRRSSNTIMAASTVTFRTFRWWASSRCTSDVNDATGSRSACNKWLSIKQHIQCQVQKRHTTRWAVGSTRDVMIRESAPPVPPTAITLSSCCRAAENVDSSPVFRFVNTRAGSSFCLTMCWAADQDNKRCKKSSYFIR